MSPPLRPVAQEMAQPLLGGSGLHGLEQGGDLACSDP